MIHPQGSPPELRQPSLAGGILAGLVGLFVVVSLVFGLAAGCKAFGRYQARADANNRVHISAIEIRNQDQRVRVARQKAQIRLQNAVGIRKAQDEISRTLTPLYVQFEMVDALKSIARSGSNNSVVYIPSGANGIPLISQAPGAVGLPSSAPPRGR